MVKSERGIRPRRAEATPRQISDQIARVKHAHAAVTRACRARRHLARYADQRVAGAAHVVATETARLTAMCGSVETPSRVLGLTPDEVRRLIGHKQVPSPDR